MANSWARNRERVTAGGPSPARFCLLFAGVPQTLPPHLLEPNLHPSWSGDVHRQTTTEDKPHSLQPLLRKTKWPPWAESLGKKASYFRKCWWTKEYICSNYRLKPPLVFPQVANKIFSCKGKIPKASNGELKIRSHYSDSYLGKPLCSLSFTLELPRQKSGKENSRQSDPDLLPPSSSWVQPRTWTACLTTQQESWQRRVLRTDLSLRMQKTALLRLPFQLPQGWCSWHPLVQPLLWTSLKESRVANTPVPTTHVSQRDPSLWSPLRLPTFSFRSTLPAINTASAYNRDETGLKQGSGLMLLRLAHTAITWSSQSSSYESKLRYFLTK